MARVKKTDSNPITPFDDEPTEATTTPTDDKKPAKRSASSTSGGTAISLLADIRASMAREGMSVDDDDVKFVIPTGIDVLDAVLGGGIAPGISQLVGSPGTGKSALAAKIISMGEQKWPNGGFLSIYIDSENTTTRARLRNLGVTNPTVISNTVTVESVFKIVDSVIAAKIANKQEDLPVCIIWDSVASTPTEKALVEENLNAVTMLRASVLNATIPKYTGKLHQYGIALICVNQLRDRVEMGGPYQKSPATMRFLQDKNIPGGCQLLHATAPLIRLQQSTVLKADAYGFDAISVKCWTIKNKLFTPNIPVECTFKFDTGYNREWSNYELLKLHKKIDCAGGWVRLISFPNPLKFRQKEFLNVYRENSEFRACFDAEVERTLKSEILDKYELASPPPVEDPELPGNITGDESVVEPWDDGGGEETNFDEGLDN